MVVLGAIVCVGIIGCMIVGIRNNRKYRGEVSEVLLGGVFSIAMTIAITCFLVAMGWIATSDTGGHPTKYDLKALSTGSGTSGNFFLGIGGFGENAKFYAYVGDNTKGFKLYAFDANRVTIVEQEGEPYLVADCGDESPAAWVAWPLDTGSNGADCHLESDNTTFYVPPGSIASNIDLSLPGSEK